MTEPDGPRPWKHRTAGELAVADVPRATPADTAGRAREALLGRTFASVAAVAVCEGERLIGLVQAERLLAASPETPLAELVDAAPPAVHPDDDPEGAAWRAASREETSVAVADANGLFKGLIPPSRLLVLMLHEHEEDMARLGGFLAGTSVARTASVEAVRRRLWHRLPWLLLGLAGAMLSAGIVASFEEQLRREVLLAFFVPAVVYMADAVGTQTETLVIRGISVGIPLRAVLVRELVTGLVIGSLIAGAFFAFSLLIWDNGELAATVALALLISSSIATLLAMALPYGLTRLGRDPAFGSGPLATVIQDLLSIIVYFAVAAVLVG